MWSGRRFSPSAPAVSPDGGFGAGADGAPAQARDVDPAPPPCSDTGGSANRGTPVESPTRRKGQSKLSYRASPVNRGFLGGKPPVSESVLLALEAEPADCPLSVSLVPFCTSRKEPAGGRTRLGVSSPAFCTIRKQVPEGKYP